MTRKDFELIASTIRAFRGEIDSDQLDAMTEAFAEKLAGTNSQFKRAAFVAAAGAGVA